MADANALAQHAYEAIIEDESLRGTLTDEGYNALVAWMTTAVMEAASRAALLPEEQAHARMDEAQKTIKDVVAVAVGAATTRDRTALLALLAQPPIARSMPARARVALAELRLGTDADTNARHLAAALHGVGA